MEKSDRIFTTIAGCTFFGACAFSGVLFNVQQPGSTTVTGVQVTGVNFQYTVNQEPVDDPAFNAALQQRLDKFRALNQENSR